jgi:hypothetical protein
MEGLRLVAYTVIAAMALMTTVILLTRKDR